MAQKNWLVIMMLMAAVCLATGCNENNTKAKPSAIAGENENPNVEKIAELNNASSSVFLINKKIAKEVGLEVVWEAKLPMKKNERLQKITILNNRLYVFSSQNFMSCLQRQNGNPDEH